MTTINITYPHWKCTDESRTTSSVWVLINQYDPFQVKHAWSLASTANMLWLIQYGYLA